MVKRPTACEVSYINGEGEVVEQELRDFKARVFLHELDHVNGQTMAHWRVSEGNIDVLPEKKKDHENLMTTVEFYKSKIDQMKAEYPEDHPVFFDGRNSENAVKDGKEWRYFENEHRQELIKGDNGKKVGESKIIPPSFEDSMLIDIVRAMRRDRREELRRRPKKTSREIEELEENQ